jgi:hypothetical protein
MGNNILHYQAFLIDIMESFVLVYTLRSLDRFFQGAKPASRPLQEAAYQINML